MLVHRPKDISPMQAWFAILGTFPLWLPVAIFLWAGC